MLSRTAACVALALTASVAGAQTRVATELLSNAAVISRGDAFRIGIRFAIPEKSHIYWHNPGDSGLPTSIDWTLPDGFRVQDLEWPIPTAFEDDVLNETTFGYENEVLLFATVRAPYTIKPGETVQIGARASWLVCLEDGMCIPEDSTLEISLPVAESLEPSPHTAVFDGYAARTPGSLAGTGVLGKISVKGRPDHSVTAIFADPWRLDAAGPAPRFFPDRGGKWLIRENPGGEQDPGQITFIPTGNVEGYTSGALALPAVNPETGEHQTVCTRFGKRPDSE